MIKIKTIEVGAFQANCFVAVNDSNRAIVIDPGADSALITSFLSSNNLLVLRYVLTHGHYDHISALAETLEAFPAPVSIHGKDAEWAFTNENRMLPLYPSTARPEKLDILRHGETSGEDDLSFKVIHSPGHTPGSVCLLFRTINSIFTGDTLFAGSVGRTDLPGGDSRALQESLKTLAKLPPETKVYPGHGPSTAIGLEMETNYFMQRLSVLYTEHNARP